MRAVVVTEPGGPERLAVVERPTPRPGPDDLLVEVRATAVNRADLLQREGHYPPPPGAPDVPGLEIAGTVAATGPDAAGWSPGDPVCAVVAGGGYAEWAIVRADNALPVPDGLDWHQAAAIPEVFATAYDNLLVRGRLAAGETVLVHGGSSGVGTAAVQLARRAGARVYVTASSAAKIAACEALGAEGGIDYTTHDFVEEVRTRTGGRGVDVVLDMIGAAYLDRNLRALAPDGRLVVIGLQKGSRAEVDLGRLLARRLTVTGSTLRARSDDEKAAVAAGLLRDVWPGFADGSLRPVVDTVLPLERVAEAHERMQRGGHIGKIVLAVRP